MTKQAGTLNNATHKREKIPRTLTRINNCNKCYKVIKNTIQTLHMILELITFILELLPSCNVLINCMGH